MIPVQSHGFGDTAYDVGNGIAVDSAGNVYSTGFFEETAEASEVQWMNLWTAWPMM